VNALLQRAITLLGTSGEINMRTTFASNIVGRRLAIVAMIVFAVCSFSVSWAQQKGAATAKQLHGHWSLVSIDSVEQGVKKVGSFGPNPKGLFIFDPSGRYSFQMFRPDLPKFASNSRMTGTAEENKAVVQGTLSHFGTYTVNEKEGTFSVRPDASSFPNWAGTIQPARKFTIIKDELTITNPSSSTGPSTSILVLKRAR
jgi:Lipocalin-like domain